MQLERLVEAFCDTVVCFSCDIFIFIYCFLFIYLFVANANRLHDTFLFLFLNLYTYKRKRNKFCVFTTFIIQAAYPTLCILSRALFFYSTPLATKTFQVHCSMESYYDAIGGDNNRSAHSE